MVSKATPVCSLSFRHVTLFCLNINFVNLKKVGEGLDRMALFVVYNNEDPRVYTQNARILFKKVYFFLF